MMGPYVMAALTNQSEVQLAPQDLPQALSEAHDESLVVLLDSLPGQQPADAALNSLDTLHRLSEGPGCVLIPFSFVS